MALNIGWGTPPSTTLRPIPCCHPIYTYPLHRLLLAEVWRKAWCVLGSPGFPSRALKKNPDPFSSFQTMQVCMGRRSWMTTHFSSVVATIEYRGLSFGSIICLATLIHALANMHVPSCSAWLAFIHLFSMPHNCFVCTFHYVISLLFLFLTVLIQRSLVPLHSGVVSTNATTFWFSSFAILSACNCCAPRASKAFEKA